MRPSGRMQACRTGWSYGATSENEKEHGSADSRLSVGLAQNVRILPYIKLDNTMIQNCLLAKKEKTNYYGLIRSVGENFGKTYKILHKKTECEISKKMVEWESTKK